MEDEANRAEALQSQFDELKADQESLSGKLVAQEHRFVPIVQNLWLAFSDDGPTAKRKEALTAFAQWMFSVWWRRTALLAGTGLIGGFVAIYSIYQTHLSLEELKSQNRMLVQQAMSQHAITSTQVLIDGLNRMDSEVVTAKDTQQFPDDFDDYRDVAVAQTFQTEIKANLTQMDDSGWRNSGLGLRFSPTDVVGLEHLSLSTDNGSTTTTFGLGTIRNRQQERSLFDSETKLLTNSGEATLLSLAQMLDDIDIDIATRSSELGVDEPDNPSSSIRTNARGALLSWLANQNVIRQTRKELLLDAVRIRELNVFQGAFRLVSLDNPWLDQFSVGESLISKSEMHRSEIRSIEIEDTYVHDFVLHTLHNKRLKVTRSVIDGSLFRGGTSLVTARSVVLYNSFFRGLEAKLVDMQHVFFRSGAGFTDSNVDKAQFSDVSFSPENAEVFSGTRFGDVRFDRTEVTWPQLCSAETIGSATFLGILPSQDKPDDCRLSCAETPASESSSSTLVCTTN